MVIVFVFIDESSLKRILKAKNIKLVVIFTIILK